MDAANIDLKGFTEDFYWKLTGSHLRDVLDTIGWVHEHTDTWLELTTLLIPGYNDARDEVQRMCRWILAELGPDVPLHLSAFHPDFKICLLYTSDAADEEDSVDLGGRRIIKKKKKKYS